MEKPDEKNTIMMPTLCYRHRYSLIHGCKYARTDPWKALEIAAQVALFQAVTCEPLPEGLKIRDVAKLGCLACYLPNRFTQIVAAGKSKDIGKIKALGERWVKEAQQ